MSVRNAWLGFAAVVASVLVACGGGSSTLPAAPGSSATTVPTTVPTTDVNGNPTSAPTTVPTTLPTNTANSTLKVTPGSIAFTTIGAQATLTATQITPTTLATSGCTAVASATVGTIAASTPITVVATGAGSCTLTITDKTGQKVNIPVSVPSSSVTPPPTVPAGTFPLLIQNNSGLPGSVTAYIIGRSINDGATYQYVPSIASPQAVTANGNVPGLTLPAIGGVIYVPPLCGARVYIAENGGTLTIPAKAAGFTGPAPWAAADLSQNVIWDFAEYSWDPPGLAGQACPNPMGLDLTAVDAIGIPIALQLYQNSQLTAGPVALQPNAGTNVATGLRTLGAPWPSLIQNFTTAQGTSTSRILNPSHAIAAPFNFPSNYLDAYMLSICQTYSSTDLIEGGAIANIPGFNTVYGRYSGTCGTPSQTLTFYTQPNKGGTVVPNATYVGVPSTSDAFMNAGYFRPAQPGDTIGRILAVGINRSTFTAPQGGALQSFTPVVSMTQPVCPATGTQTSSPFYGGSATSGGLTLNSQVTTNWYSALAHTNAFANNVYGFADDDECKIYAPYINGPNTAAPGTYFQLTLEPF